MSIVRFLDLILLIISLKATAKESINKNILSEIMIKTF